MKYKNLLKLSALVTATVLMASCAKNHHGLGAPEVIDGSAHSQGLGQFARFGGQEEGESYTSKAPHNQVYLFQYDDASFNNKYMDSLNAQANYLRTHSGAHILLAGHTDERGSREYNIALGERRANSVAEILRMAGVSHRQYRVVSYGKERPVYMGHDDVSHRQNRRVEFIYEATR